jgi:hypothetical protein
VTITQVFATRHRPFHRNATVSEDGGTLFDIFLPVDMEAISYHFSVSVA